MSTLGERRNIMEDNPAEVSRPLLIFNHNPKAGGGSILETLREFKPRETTCISKLKMSKKSNGAKVSQAYGSSCGAKAYKDAFSEEEGGVDEVLFHVRESAGTARLDRHLGFVIGSIREPCSQYLSLWSFGSNGMGSFRNGIDAKLYGVSKPYFNTTSDKERFWAWMKHPSVAGFVGQRVKDSYGESVLDAVDCWVFVEDFQDSLLRCLRMYADQGGFVDWQAPTVSSLLGEENKRNKMNLHKSSENGGKSNPLGDPRSSHHGKCESMFDLTTAKQVEENTESFVYDLFGYEGCCRPGTNFYPRRDDKVPTEYDGEAEDTANSTGSLHVDIVKNTLPFNHSNGTTIASSTHVVLNPRQSPDVFITYAVVVAVTIAGVLLVTFDLFLRRQQNKSANPGIAADVVQSAETEFSAAEDRNLLDEDEMLKFDPTAEDDEIPPRRMEIE